MKIAVLDAFCTNPGDLSWAPLESLGECRIFDRTPQAEVVAQAAGAEALLVNKVQVGRAELDGLPQVRYIGVLATGFNIVDVAAARERGITVTNIPTYGTASVAQHAIALLLEITNQVAAHNTAVHAGEWSRSADWSMARTPLVELAGQSFGVIGFGRIGQATARIAAALGMEVVAHDHAYPESLDFPFRRATQDEVLGCDVVSLHCPLTPDNRHLIRDETIGRMKPSAILLNTSRGPLVEEAALARALREGRIAGAGLDVVDQEPPREGSPLFGMARCVITPHIAWASRQARQRLADLAVENLRRWIEGRPQNVVS